MIIPTFLICWLALYLVVSERTEMGNALLRLTLSLCATAAILSFLYSLLLFAGFPLVVFDVISTILPLGYVIAKRNSLRIYDIRHDIKNASYPFLVIGLALILLFCHHYFAAVVRWGEWDAWAIWSQHAKFLLSGDQFGNLFSEEMSWSHPDYPLMLPSVLAMFWNSFGITPYVPALLAWAFSVTLLLVITGSFLEKGYRLLGMLLLFLLVYSKVLFPFVVSQYADTLFGLFMLLPFIIVKHTPFGKPHFYLLLTGFFAASCTWIKNEGLAFFAIFSLCFLIVNLKDLRVVRYYILGTLLPLTVLAIYKFAFPFPSDFLTDADAALAKLADASRYRIVLEYGYEWFGQNAGLLWMSMIGILLVNYRYYISFPFIVVLLLACSYFLVYIITPFDLEWHLSTSFDRLIHQLVPVLMYSMFMSVGEKWSTAFKVRKFTNGRVFGFRTDAQDERAGPGYPGLE